MTSTRSQGEGEEGARKPKAPLGEAVAIVGGLVLAAAAVFWWASTQGKPEKSAASVTSVAIDPKYSEYVGEQTCAKCHVVESARHQGSGHAKTLRAASSVDALRQLDGREVRDPEHPDVSWRFSHDKAGFSAQRTDERGETERHLIEYVFGSGRHATTFVSLLERDPSRLSGLEHRLSVFAHDGSIDITPGQVASVTHEGKTPYGRVLTGRETRLCFSCHATVISNRGSEVLDEATMIPNVSCERCHGPGKRHVEAAQRGASPTELKMPFGPKRWTAHQQMELCGQCHRLPSMVVPPEDLRPENPVLVRFQPVGMMQSACYLNSEGKMSCLTCHDAHARPSTDRKSYETICLSCHQEKPQTTCSLSSAPRNGCLDCHMPRVTITRGMVATDHWIRTNPQYEEQASAGPVKPVETPSPKPTDSAPATSP